MAARDRAAKAGSAYQSVASSPYIQRIVQDAELRENIRDAFKVSRRAYGRLANGKAPSKALMEDKKLQKDLRQAAEALRNAGTSLREGPKKSRRRGGLGRKLLVLAVGGGLALALSSDLRAKVLDVLFGKEEEFDYTSTTSNNSPPSAPKTEDEPAGAAFCRFYHCFVVHMLETAKQMRYIIGNLCRRFINASGDLADARRSVEQ